ncbi:hypothetical protein [Prevotella jejuni]|uniref:hypothetical protein n=1 Tax=Prevotella jejuni TaxID=1177574 RepID=UPI000C7C56A6|nr:hypothetical protein [Prevotella jejuni]
MIQAINNNFNKRSTLQNKGVRHAIAVSNSLMDESKKVEKKIVNYLVVPNNFVLSLSLSHRAGLTYFLILFIRARGSPCITMVNKGLLGVSFVHFLYPYMN